ncbi:chromosome partitioning protein [Thermosporothrix hazakensis]|jgi:chromosome partitioning protein|uniref:Chromosome partitioning protein n=2 Tax=Thermosporothrix TaxID=768650 RepID=A0A326U8R0_THEHA|nr:ParA family protein [Thermosporothrix hazakensis]PZW29585.1 chromosome partitioning protein [Thermosporothrix hazakensis]BBH85869.1 sporulation initiation inhibitor Soj [Thermosporothrix sp. COM3]GCE45704.1 sporulation initiation inhibitor Soj [Thermosporothrix hazakensis]
MQSTRIFALCNNKGGVTKTTTTINLGYGLARAGRRVLLVDTDAQSNTTYSLLGNLEQEPTLFDVLINGTKLADAIVETGEPNLHLVPSSINLSAADLLMASAPGRERKLMRALTPIKENYDYILIDTPPNLGVLTVNAFIACTDVIIPIALTTYALIGISILESTMQELRDNLDVELPIFGVVANLDDHTRLSNNVLGAVRDHFGSLVFDTVIPRNIKVEEAHNQIACIFDYAPMSTGAQAYTKLVKEVLHRAEGI